MDTKKLEPQAASSAYSLISIIIFTIICFVGLLFIAVLLYQWFTRPVSPYSALTPATDYLKALV